MIGASIAMFVIYAVLWIGIVADWRWLAAIDDGSLQRFYDYGAKHPGWISFWVGVSNVFSPTAMRILALAGIIGALLRRKRRMAVFLTITVMAMGLLTVVAKGLSDRPRPTTALISETSTSFPSGHALGIMVSVLVFLTILWPTLPPRMRYPAAILGTVIVFAVGIARVVLNVHHATDVIAGWALGLGYYLLCVMLVPPRPGISGSLNQVPQR